MIFFFIVFNAAVSQRYCVCQPDRPGAVCTLENKCENFKNLDQILLIENKRSHESKSFINISQILQKNRKEGEYQINLDFDVFGSLPSKPIVFDFTKTENIIKNAEKMHVSINIKGNEWKQIINITGIDSLSSNIWSNFTAYSISLSIFNIAVLFDVNEKNFSSSAFLDTLKIQKSRLIFPNKKPFIFNTRNLYTDTYSSYTDFGGKIITNQMSFLDTPNPTSIRNLQYPIEIKKLEDSNKTNRNIKESTNEKEEDSIYENFQYTFCLSTKDHSERAFDDQDCEMHSVPHDEDHYISIKSTNVTKIIENAPSNNIIRFFLTTASQTNPCSFILPQFKNANHTIFFQVADPDIPTYLTLKGSNPNTNNTNVNVTFTSVATVNINVDLLSSFTNITLRNSPIIFSDDQEKATIQNLVTDSQSISQFKGLLTILETIELRKTTSRRLSGAVFMSDNSTIYVPQVSNFPVILFKQAVENGQFSISFCDDGEYIEMPFYFNQGLINVALSDNTLTIKEPINITFRSDANSFDRTDLSKTPKINITTFVPSQGIRVTFGTQFSPQWPCYSVFTFENLNPGNDTAAYPLVYLTINDGKLIQESNAEKSIFLYFYRLNVMLLSFPTFGPFIHGVNKKYSNEAPYQKCPSIPRPYFTNLTSDVCYQTGVYEAGYITFDTSDILESAEFESKTIYLGVDDGSNIKIPSVFNNIVILTTSNEINYKLKEGEIGKTKPLTLIPSKQIEVTFEDSFVDGFENHADIVQKLKIEHESVDVNLYTKNGKPVPPISLDDPVQGIHFYTAQDDNSIDYEVKDDSYENSRVGPNVIVNFNENINVPQTAFLANKVTFDPGSTKRNVGFIYYNESVADYTFINTTLSFTNANSSNKIVNFTAKSVTFENSEVSQDTNSVKLNFDVNEITLTDIRSIPDSSFSSPIFMHDRCIIKVNELSKILFGANSIKLYLNDLETATIVHAPKNTISADTRSIKSSTKSTLADEIPNSGFYVETQSNNKIDLEVSGSTLPDDFQLKLQGDDPTIEIDKSFNNIKVPDNFEILSNTKYNIVTDLRELPAGIGDGAVNVKHSKQKLTNNMAFIIFIAIFGVIFLITIILCVVGLTCMPEPEQYDMSSDAGGIFDMSRDLTDETINKGEKDGEMDKSSSGVALNDDSLEDIQPEENKKEEEVEPKKVQAVAPNDSYSVEIDQEENTDSVDNYFDEIDRKSEEKNNK